MKTIRNISRRPISVPLPAGRKIFLAPGQGGEIADLAATHAPLVALIEAGELELAEGAHKGGSSSPAGAVRSGSGAAAHHPVSKAGRRGDRGG